MRNATVLTTAATTVLCIDKQTYESTIRTAYEADITERVAFLRGVFLFEGWADEALRRIAHVIRPRELPAGRTVVRQGGHSNSSLLSGAAPAASSGGSRGSRRPRRARRW